MKKFALLFIALFGFCTSMTAREVIGINDNWRFYFSSENSADYARTISLPHTWTFGTTSQFLSSQPTTANYIKEIYVPSSWAQKRIFVKFYGVESVADLLINGRYVGEHRGGSTAFTFEISDFVTFNDNNRLHVVVNNAPQTDVMPISHEENRYGGIYRDVEIIVTDKTTISPLYYGSDGVFVENNHVSDQAAEGIVRVHLNSSVSNSCALSLSICDSEGNVVFDKNVAKAKISAEPVAIPFIINSPALWSPSDPNLYSVCVSLSDGDYSDKIEVTTGFRSIEVAQNGLLKINGEPTQFRGVSLYHDYPHVGGAATERDIDIDMEIIEELGANAIRSVTQPHHPYLYDLCDERGKLVWIDFPFTKSKYLSDIAYYPTEAFHQNGRETVREIIAQNYNHPSVVMWGVFSLLNPRGNNPIPYIKELNSLAKSIDAARLTVAVSDQDGEINTITDLVVWNQALGWDKGLFSDIDIWSNLLHTNWSSMRSGVIYGQNSRFDQQAEESSYKSTNGYSVDSWHPEGRGRKFHEEYSKRILVDSLFWGVCLNSIFDFKSARNPLGENNTGLVTFDRRNRKDIFYLYKAHWNKAEPTLHITDSRNKVSSSRSHKISVYTSCDTIPPMLYTERDTITMKRVAPWHFTSEEVVLNDGANKFVVKQGEMADSVKVIFQSIIKGRSLRTPTLSSSAR